MMSYIYLKFFQNSLPWWLRNTVFLECLMSDLLLALLLIPLLGGVHLW
jgi:hypothetical protein